VRSAHSLLRLLGSFELAYEGVPVPLPMSARRVIAFVALHGHPVQRTYVAGTLWLTTSDARAHANLRSALWRLHRAGHRLIESTDDRLRLGETVRVDLRDAEALARRAMSPGDKTDIGVAVDRLASDLLPDWYEDWILLERERFRALRLGALESICERLMQAERFRDAVDAAHVAVAAEPLRESAHRTLVRIHLAEGNVGEAIRQYCLFRRLIREQLGLEPSERMEELMNGILVADTAR
jgi:DNA-binding SARP family transcriptional activator